MNMKKNWIKKALPAVAAFALMFGLLAFAAPAPVSAASGLDETPPPAQAEGGKVPLSRVYQKLVDLQVRQEERLAGADDRIVDFEERIAGLKAEGKDVTALEEAVAAYAGAVNEAKALNGDAAAILQAHAGFDADGNVVDAAAAKETLKSAGEKLRAAVKDLRPSLREVLRVLREYRRDNR